VGGRDARVDAYIGKAAPFARPILTRIRDIVHDACPSAEETIKWGMPFFMYQGVLCHMAAFKRHCAFGFWKGKLVVGDAAGTTAMGQFGRISEVSELPPRATLARYLKRAMQLNEAGVKSPTRARATRPARVTVPRDLAAALARNRAARATFDGLSPSGRREYVEWITDAKRDETRRRRLETAVEWLAGGKPRNWQYLRR